MMSLAWVPQVPGGGGPNRAKTGWGQACVCWQLGGPRPPAVIELGRWDAGPPRLFGRSLGLPLCDEGPDTSLQVPRCPGAQVCTVRPIGLLAPK